MRINFFNKKVISALLILEFTCSFTSISQDSNSIIHTENSSYLMDKNLTASGYSLKKENNDIVLQYKNEDISLSQFYASSLGSDKAIKLYISLQGTFEKANIFLNNKLLSRTDDKGNAVIDRYFKKGNFHLQLTDDQGKNALNFYFELNENSRLICSGIGQFSCQKTPY